MLSLSTFWEQLIAAIIGGFFVTSLALYAEYRTRFLAATLDKKELTYRTSSPRSFSKDVIKELVSTYKKHLKISWKGKTIEDLIIVEVELKNTGRNPILKDDYSQPIRIEITGALLYAELKETAPSGIDVELKEYGPTYVEIKSVLRNPGHADQ